MAYRDTEKRFQQFKDWLRARLGFAKRQEQVHDEATIQMFTQLSPDEKLQLIKPQLDFYTSAVSRKTDILPTMATLAATLIVVTSLNTNLVPLSSTDAKVALTIFLVLIPITLHYYIKTMEKTAKKATEIIASYHGQDPFRNIKISFIDQLNSDFPIIIVYVLYAVVLFILFKMW